VRTDRRRPGASGVAWEFWSGGPSWPDPDDVRSTVRFLDVIWFIIVSFFFIAYLMVMFSIVSDLFRDRSTGGGAKAMWVLGLIFLPVLTALIYLFSRGDGMAERAMEQAQRVKAAQDDYIRTVATETSPADQIAKAKELLDSGVIDQGEFEALKAKALA
jgi:ABC-type multidrug transport system fused ATPase/permease subunit